jgi:hypothetical protein
MCQLGHKPTDSGFEMKMIYTLLNANSFSHKLHHFAATQLQWQNILLVLWYTCHVKPTAGQYKMRTFAALKLFHTLYRVNYFLEKIFHILTKCNTSSPFRGEYTSGYMEVSNHWATHPAQVLLVDF